MRKIIKNPIFTFIIGIIITGSIGVYAATSYVASQVTYKNTTVDKALDDLYTKANGFCKKITGNKTTIGSKYECDPGDGEYRVFYVLKVNDDTVELIMDRNINSGTMNYATAMSYLTSGDGKALRDSWLKTNNGNVEDVTIPKAEDIAKAVGNDTWDVTTTDKWFYFDKNGSSYGQTQVANASNKSAYGWLYSNLRECNSYGCPLNTSLDSTGAYGYWTQDKIYNDSNRVWGVDRNGNLGRPVSNDTNYGVRPVITVLKSQLN